MSSSLWYQGFESGIHQTVQHLLSFGHCKFVIWSVIFTEVVFWILKFFKNPDDFIHFGYLKNT